ncbi:MAG: hypothetical protein A2268_03560 [Candidatus Raymondbacteria bacterium RifOxyA12_full_50_37]|uniref:Uncharacterized protein n=1 Tax=Candidatus Raymondbacteria bacterium RIFOXYD12_FULL_49_13 TaxID=1817890 RepID=A0A1F7F4U7_UNCRA|nr:MAG: hypothetical protein A2268_03560 [Candidatus Raymondbacteria bacterium RifOxyA12_full_50_37]OGJ91871.1 MAG: hypothetical protein A2248_04630 [Candidatus Raymondbacteria bacterium RIFOXYA2_FULL_49_16]OGJ98091.1 MAG: hypothetical protein A2453_12385 [Candidatus Raymondbacteria bacterium RIFOXYC2_FULL_50_21]OGK01679.1 MAG: hypothetical protein A2519_09115 [Candidatus Raymondbacteria bacterium RIFOXYD12_FULL_49_13]OGK02324.1 MAG: hypothetical protein A2350_03045 [Candidatus Raymondbacteria 
MRPLSDRAAGLCCAALLFALCFFDGTGCTPGKNTAANPALPDPGPGDSVDLVVDSVTINGVRTDTLFCAFDSLTCDTLALVRIHLSQWPVMRYSAACNMVAFDNSGNNRYECYTCAQRARCNGSDSVGSVAIDSGALSISVRSLMIVGLGSDTGSCAIHLSGMFDDTFLDSMELDTVIRLFW